MGLIKITLSQMWILERKRLFVAIIWEDQRDPPKPDRLAFLSMFFFQFITKLQVKPSYFVLVDNTKSCDRVLEVEVWVKRTKVRLLDALFQRSVDGWSGARQRVFQMREEAGGALIAIQTFRSFNKGWRAKISRLSKCATRQTIKSL